MDDHWIAQPNPAPVGIDVDEEFDFADTDSALGDEISVLSSTISLSSSVLRELEENGRKYHGYKDGKYILPMDEPELERQEFQYHLCLQTFDNKLNFAPVEHAHRVLDAGCGPGFWAIDFAEKHPHAKVIGIDLSPIQPPFMPPNVIFEIDDLEEPWTFSFKFDYVHASMMTGAFRDWPRFMGQAYDFLNPGGYLELQDIDFPVRCDDGSLPADCALRRWSDLLMEAGRRSGFALDTCGQAADMMRQAGFVDVVQLPYTWPMNRWPRDQRLKQIGRWNEENFVEGCEAMSMALLTRHLGWTREEVVDFSARVRADIADSRKHAYFPLYVTYGRKP
ncbi:hypothetical protein RB594_007597 [Gaeumannomyces avenae]